MSWDSFKKARQRLAREQGTITKDWGGRIPVALIYPNSYYVGMSNLGLHAVYNLLNSHREIVTERVFWEREDRDEPTPPISLESRRPLSDFAALAFSVNYELDYFNVVQIIRASGLPLYATDRDERYPLVIAGGPAITANPMPLSPFLDCLGIGEAEVIISALLPVLAEGTHSKRHELLKKLASLPGVFVPLAHPGIPVVRQWASNLDDFPVAYTVLTPDTELGDLYLIEVERGCPRNCRFCLTGNILGPARHRSLDTLIVQARLGLEYRRRIGLVGSAVADYPQLEELLVRLRQMGAGLSISSLRISPLSRTVLQALAEGGAQTVTIAPEAGTQRLRQVIRKGISKDEILESISKVAEASIKQLKLYFMIGLPTETDEDIEAMINLTLRSKDILDRRSTGSRLSLNIAPFVPKANTPFQWLPMASVNTLNRRLSQLKKSLAPKGIKIKGESPAWSHVQGALARGDEKLAGVLAGTESVSLAGWRQAAEKCHLDIDFYTNRRWDTGQKLPWAVLDPGTEPSHLEVELDRALKTRTK